MVQEPSGPDQSPRRILRKSLSGLPRHGGKRDPGLSRPDWLGGTGRDWGSESCHSRPKKGQGGTERQSKATTQ